MTKAKVRPEFPQEVDSDRKFTKYWIKNTVIESSKIVLKQTLKKQNRIYNNLKRRHVKQ